MGGPFASAEELTEATGLEVELARAQRVLRMASDAIRAFCGQELSVVEDHVEVIDPIEKDRFLLSERPVTAIAEIEVAGSVVAPAEYSFTSYGRVTRSNAVFWTEGATVTYSHGYTEADWEFGVFRSIAIDAAAAYISNNDRGAGESFGAQIVEVRGFAPAIFLTEEQQSKLSDFGKVLVG